METKKLTLQDMMVGLQALTAAELLQLNKQLNVIYKSKNTIARQTVAVEAVTTGKFQVGDVVKFYKSGRGRSAGWNYFKFDHMNRKGDCMQGPSCDENGHIHSFPTQWTVAVTQPTLEVAFRNSKPIKA